MILSNIVIVSNDLLSIETGKAALLFYKTNFSGTVLSLTGLLITQLLFLFMNIIFSLNTHSA